MDGAAKRIKRREIATLAWPSWPGFATLCLLCRFSASDLLSPLSYSFLWSADHRMSHFSVARSLGPVVSPAVV